MIAQIHRNLCYDTMTHIGTKTDQCKYESEQRETPTTQKQY